MVVYTYTFSLLIMPIFLLVLLILLRSFGFTHPFRPEQFHARSVKSGTWTSRLIEALLLFCVAGIILVFSATNTSTGGYLLMLDQLNTAFAAVNLQVAVGAGLGLLLSMLLCLLWRSFTGTLVAAGVVIVYATLLNGPGDPLERLAGPEAGERQVTWTIQLGGCDVDGAELWVNGVRLGTLPYTTTLDEFKAKVPFWPEPPAAMVSEEDRWKMPSYSPWNWGGYDQSWRRWAKIVMPGESAKRWGVERDDSKEAEAARTYYAQVKYGDEWGYSRGKSGGGGGGRYIYHTTTSIKGVRFPKREKRLEALLDRARLANYRPADEWFDAIESFGEDAVVALRRLTATEMQLDEVLTQWAARRYQLDQVTDPASAWRAFEVICDEADRQQFYSTASIAGRAVEMLVPMLDAQTLARKAIKIIRSTNSYGWYHWYLGGEPHFGYAERPKGLRTGGGRTMGAWRGGGRNKLPMHAYAVAQAVWQMDHYLDGQDPCHENVIEQKVVPEFLVRSYDDIDRVKLANTIGSATLDSYLLRQDWRADVKQLPWDHRFHIIGTEVNGWLYLLSTLNSPAGDTFRQKHAHRITDMADGVTVRVDTLEELEFLFGDLDKGKKSLAYQYWLRFKTLARRQKYHAIVLQYEYLVRMEPVSTAEMYVDAYREFDGDYGRISEAFRELKALPAPKRELVYTALWQAVEEDVSHVSGWPASDPNGTRDYLLRNLKNTQTKHMLADELINDLHSETPRAKPERVKAWLAHEEPEHPLMIMLADDNDPALRVLVLDAIEQHPTPANRQILQKLLADDEEQVRQAARGTSSALEALAAMPLSSLVSRPSGSF